MKQLEEAADDRYLGIAELAHYSGLSQHTIRKHLTDATRPLKHYRVGGRLLVKKSEFDRWMEAVAVGGHGAVDPAPPQPREVSRDLRAAVAAAVKDIRGG
ncbi:MAG: helix-turn-helix domain-containing protein [Vicinamibacterales bacterium]|nr:helix-turn-helix domain-containing protein [Vicinamibacterales bacterium]